MVPPPQKSTIDFTERNVQKKGEDLKTIVCGS